MPNTNWGNVGGISKDWPTRLPTPDYIDISHITKLLNQRGCRRINAYPVDFCDSTFKAVGTAYDYYNHEPAIRRGFKVEAITRDGGRLELTGTPADIWEMFGGRWPFHEAYANSLGQLGQDGVSRHHTVGPTGVCAPKHAISVGQPGPVAPDHVVEQPLTDNAFSRWQRKLEGK